MTGLDLAGWDAVEATVAAFVADGINDVAVRADRVTFAGSSGLGGILAVRATIAEAPGTFWFGPMSSAIAPVVDPAGVRDVLSPTAN